MIIDESMLENKIGKLKVLLKQGILSKEEFLDTIRTLTKDINDYDYMASDGLNYKLIYYKDYLGYEVSQGECDDPYVYIPDKYKGLPVISIGEYGFSEKCSDYEEIRLPSGLIYISEGAFSDCYYLKNISLPASLQYMDCLAFSGCESLSYLYLPDSLTYIGEDAFLSCKSLYSLTFPSGLKEMPSYLMRDCDRLKKITLSKGIEIIDYSAFHECLSVVEINLPDSIKTIRDSAFSLCNSLEEIHYSADYDSWLTIEKQDGWNTDMPSCKLVCADKTVQLGAGEAYAGTNKQIEAFLRTNPPKIIKEQLIQQYLDNLDD